MLTLGMAQRLGVLLNGNGISQALHRAAGVLEYVERGAFDIDALKAECIGSMRWDYDAAHALRSFSNDPGDNDVYRYQATLVEMLARLGSASWRVSIWKQVIPLGKGILLSPADRLAPRDERYPGFELPSEQRLGSWSVRTGAFFGAHRIEMVGVAEWEFGLRPPPLGDFSPLRGLLSNGLQSGGVAPSAHWENRPDHFSPRDLQFAGWWQYDGEGVDLGVIAGSTLDRQGVPGVPTVDSENSLALSLIHSRYEWAGVIGAALVGPLAVHWEAVIDRERPLATFSTDGMAVVGRTSVDMVDVMIG